MGDQGFDRQLAPWERLRAGFDAEANKPTLVQAPKGLLESERAPRTLPARRIEDSLLDLESRLDAAALGDAALGHRTLGDAAAGSAAPAGLAEGELEAAHDDAWSPAPRSNEPSHIGQVIDNRYIVESLIARGGMGIVYRCRHKLIDRRFAVKIIRGAMAHLPDAPRRFLMEAKAASAIGNEHIIDVVDYGTLADGSAYLVMELLEGVPLSDEIAKHETLPVARITAIAAQICEGLRAAHEAGIVHRDLKPENIFLTNRKMGDFVKILDFGIAKMARSGEPLTRKGLIVGTPHYMSPEQAAGAVVDARGDIYSLGIMLYELSTGRVPFDAAHYMAVLAKHMAEPPPPFDTLHLTAKLPPEFEAIVLRCLAKRPDQRYQTMTDVMVELERLNVRLRSPSPTPAPAPPIETMLPIPPVTALSDAPRSTGQSVPAALGRSVVVPPRRRNLGLLLTALVLATLTGVSLLRLQRPHETPGDGEPRSALELPPPASNTGAPVPDSVKAPLAPAPAGPERPASPTLGAAEGTPAAAAAATAGAGSGTPPSSAGAASPSSSGAGSSGTPTEPGGSGGAADTGALAAMEPLTVVQLAPGKSVEIEARTRLSLWLTNEAPATSNVGAERTAARQALKARRASGANDGAAPAGRRGAGKKVRSQKAAEGKAAGDDKAAGEAERDANTRAPSELMNPWPAPVIGPAKE